MIVIGLTGGIGSGKSTAAAYLKSKGAFVIDADRVGHDIYKGGSEGWREVVETFGRGIVGPDGEIDRKKLGGAVFSDPAKLEWLNTITHPLIDTEIASRLEEHRRAGTEVVVVEAALLVEGGWKHLVDEVWLLTAPDEIAKGRVVRKSGRPAKQVEAILKAQLSDDERRRHADVVIDNSGSIAELGSKLDKLWERLERRNSPAVQKS